MARIPEFKRTFIPQGPTPSAEALAAPGRALGQFANAVRGVEDYNARVAKAKKTSDLASAIAFSTSKRLENNALIKADTENWETSLDAHTEQDENIDKAVKERYPDIYTAWNEKDSINRTKGKIEIQNWHSGRNVDQQRADLQVVEDSWVNYAVDDGSESGMMTAVNNFDNLLADKESDGSITEQERVDKREAFSKRITDGFLERDIRSDPELALKRLDDEYYRLPAEKAEAAKTRAQIRLDAVIAKNVKIKEQEEKDISKALKQTQRDNAVEFSVAAERDGFVDMVALTDALEDSDITLEYFNSQKAKSATATDKSDESEYARVRELAKDGYASDSDLVNNSRLGHTDVTRLIDLNEQAQSAAVSSQIKDGHDYLRSVIISTAPWEKIIPGQQERLENAKDEYEDRILKGDDPAKIKEDMQRRYATESNITINALPKLRLPGITAKPQSMDDVQFARKVLFIAVNNGTILEDDAKLDAALLEQYERTLTLQGGVQ